MDKKALKALGFSEEVKKIEKGICPVCNNPVEFSKLKDEAVRREHEISGLCYGCMNSIFLNL